MKKRKWLIVAITILVIFALAVVFVRKPRQAIDLTALSSLHPISRLHDDGGPVIITISQPVENVRKFLDQRLNPRTGWVSAGYEPTGFFWYRLDNWEQPIQKLFAEVGIMGPEITIQSKTKSSSEMTIWAYGGYLILPP